MIINLATILAKIPLDPSIVALTDKGRSVLEGEPGSRVRMAYEGLARGVVKRY